MIEILVKKLAAACKERRLNFVIAVEDHGIHDCYSVSGETELRKVVDALRNRRRD